MYVHDPRRAVGGPLAPGHGRPAGNVLGAAAVSALAPILQGFFTDRLIAERHASTNTVTAYRNAIRLLLRFAAARTGKQPSDLDTTDLDAPLIGAFLHHLETDRGNSATTRNARLAAIHSLFRYAAYQAAVTARVLAILLRRTASVPSPWSTLDHKITARTKIKAVLTSVWMSLGAGRRLLGVWSWLWPDRRAPPEEWASTRRSRCTGGRGPGLGAAPAGELDQLGEVQWSSGAQICQGTAHRTQ